jgi:hypothetical protein
MQQGISVTTALARDTAICEDHFDAVGETVMVIQPAKRQVVEATININITTDDILCNVAIAQALPAPATCAVPDQTIPRDLNGTWFNHTV